MYKNNLKKVLTLNRTNSTLQWRTTTEKDLELFIKTLELGHTGTLDSLTLTFFFILERING